MSRFDPDARATAVADLVATRTTTWTRPECDALDAVIAALKPSARHLADVLDWLDEIASRDGTRAAAALSDPELQGTVHAHTSAPERLKRWKARLRRMRFPRLAAREAAIAAEIAALDLGAKATVTPPPDLEGGVVTVMLRARSSAELGAAVDRLRASVSQGCFDRLFALLAEL